MINSSPVWLLASAACLSGCSACETESTEIPPCPSSAAIAGSGQAPPPDHEAQPLAGASLAQLLKTARRSRNADYVAPTEAELSGYRRWVTAVAKSAMSDELPSQLPASGFVGRLAQSGQLWVLQEAPQHRRGGGVVVIRPSWGSPVIIEAPHTFFDQGTLEIALAAFDKLAARALLINTMHRGGEGTAEERRELAMSGESESDVAHQDVSFFSTAHAALIEVDPQLVALQFHGFSDETLPKVEVVISAAKTTANVQALATALQPVVGEHQVRVYPDQVKVLGGTTNAQARVSRKARSPFVHLEISRSFRERLGKDTELRERFLRALQLGIGGSRR